MLCSQVLASSLSAGFSGGRVEAGMERAACIDGTDKLVFLRASERDTRALYSMVSTNSLIAASSELTDTEAVSLIRILTAQIDASKKTILP